MTPRRAIVASALAWLLAALHGPASACTVPVFRYGLERWQPDRHIVVVFHRGPLDADCQARVDRLRQAAQEQVHPANIEVVDADLAAQAHPWAQELGVSEQSLPWLAVLYPPREVFPGQSEPAMPPVAWQGALATAPIETLLDSPARREIARRLLQGQSAVWVLVESGDRAADDAAEALLNARSRELEATIKLSALEPADPDAVSDGSEPVPTAFDMRYPWAPAVPLQVRFSVVRLSPRDAAEAPFAAMLTAFAEEPLSENSPAAVAVFGRGRALPPLAGADLTGAVIDNYCTFLCGNCSCQIKELNPGTDMLMRVDWDSLVTGQYVLDRDLPPLTGVMPAAALPGGGAVSAPAHEAPAPAVGVPSRPSGGLLRNTAIAGGVLLGGVALATILLRCRRRGDQT